jgi:hypothetical protein
MYIVVDFDGKKIFTNLNDIYIKISLWKTKLGFIVLKTK